MRIKASSGEDFPVKSPGESSGKFFLKNNSSEAVLR